MFCRIRKSRPSNIPLRLLSLCAVLACGGMAAVSGQGMPDAAPGEYQVRDGKVDARTFLGWSAFHDTCVNCHGQGGVGSAMAPNLVTRIADYTPASFEERVLSRYLLPVTPQDMASESGSSVRDIFLAQIQRSRSAADAGVDMPKWETNPVVRERIDAIYTYLKARADGALGPERPSPLPAE